MSALTASQQRILDEVRAAGHKTYNGLARRPIEALEAQGLVTVDWDQRAHVKGSGIELTWKITVTPVAGKEVPTSVTFFATEHGVAYADMSNLSIGASHDYTWKCEVSPTGYRRRCVSIDGNDAGITRWQRIATFRTEKTAAEVEEYAQQQITKRERRGDHVWRAEA